MWLLGFAVMAHQRSFLNMDFQSKFTKTKPSAKQSSVAAGHPWRSRGRTRWRLSTGLPPCPSGTKEDMRQGEKGTSRLQGTTGQPQLAVRTAHSSGPFLPITSFCSLHGVRERTGATDSF